MKFVLLFVFIIIVYSIQVTKSEWILEFSDEFDGEELDSRYWTTSKELIETSSGRRSYSPSNSRVSKGNLRIEPDLDDLKSKTFVGKTVQSKIRWSKRLFKMRFMFPLNDNIWSTIYLFSGKANIDFVSQISNEKLSHDIQTGVVLHTHDIKTGAFQHSYKSFSEVEKQTPIHNMTHSFNEVSMEWTNEKIVWKLNDQHINEVNLKRFSSGNKTIDKIFNDSFRLIIALTLRQEFYIDSNFNLNDIQKSYLDIDYIKVYKWRKTEINTQSYPVTNNTMPTVENPVANNTMTSVVNSDKSDEGDKDKSFTWVIITVIFLGVFFFASFGTCIGFWVYKRFIAAAPVGRAADKIERRLSDYHYDIYEGGYYNVVEYYSEWNNGRKETVYDDTKTPPIDNYESFDESHRSNASVNNAAPKTLS